MDDWLRRAAADGAGRDRDDDDDGSQIRAPTTRTTHHPTTHHPPPTLLTDSRLPSRNVPVWPPRRWQDLKVLTALWDSTNAAPDPDDFESRAEVLVDRWGSVTKLKRALTIKVQRMRRTSESERPSSGIGDGG